MKPPLRIIALLAALLLILAGTVLAPVIAVMFR